MAPSASGPAAQPGPAAVPSTYAAQSKLKRLPIPELRDTCERYLASIRPLQTDEQHKRSQAAVAQFLQEDGERLQHCLKRYARDKSSYIEQFWFDSYLNFDNSVVLNLNPFFLLEDDPTPSRNDQVLRAASLTYSALCFVRALRREELPADNIRGAPLCMYQYARMFGTARIPTENGCVMQTSAYSRCLAVSCNDQIYWFDVLDSNNDLIVTERDLMDNFRAIKADAEAARYSDVSRQAIGILTSENRKVWAEMREQMKDDPDGQNWANLQIVDSALFVVCLDNISPHSPSEACNNMLCGTYKITNGSQSGTCMNRWYDKLQLIVCENGTAGVNFEHTGIDGHTVLRFVGDIFTDTILRFARSITQAASSIWLSDPPDPRKLPESSFAHAVLQPRRLQWHMTPKLSRAVRFAETHLSDLILQSEMQVLEFHDYGKNFITSMGFSPDAFVQLAFQAAYYSLYGSVECTYEPAMTKMFLHGRTEAIRPVTQESVAFVEQFCDDFSTKIKVNALRKACAKHTSLTKQCAQGHGHDRHLYALYCLWQRGIDMEQDEDDNNDGNNASEDGNAYEGSDSANLIMSSSPQSRTSGEYESDTGSAARRSLPSIFADAGWHLLNNTILSTSNCGNPSLRIFGFGPVSPEGFGIGYIIKDSSISICASSKHRQTERFLQTLAAYLLQIRSLLREDAAAQGKSSSSNGAPHTKLRPHERGSGHGKGMHPLSVPLGSGPTVPGVPIAPSTPLSVAQQDEDPFGLNAYNYFDMGGMDSRVASRTNSSSDLQQLATQTRSRESSRLG